MINIALYPPLAEVAAQEEDIRPINEPLMQDIARITPCNDLQQALSACQAGQCRGMVYTTYEVRPIPNEGEMYVTVNDMLRIAAFCQKEEMQDVIAALTKENVVTAIKLVNKWMRRDFLLTRPRIAVLALHNQDESEETDILMPAIEDVIAEDINVFGPFPAQSFFSEGDFMTYDAILALTPQQVQMAAQATPESPSAIYLGGSEMVQTLVNADNITTAIYLAKDIAAHRQQYDLSYRDPLQKLYHEKR